MKKNGISALSALARLSTLCGLLALSFLIGCSNQTTTKGVPGVAGVGQSCAPEGAFVCEGTDKDAPRELVCSGGQFVPYAECAGGCWVETDLMGERYVACVQPTQLEIAPLTDAGTLEDSVGNQIQPPDISSDEGI